MVWEQAWFESFRHLVDDDPEMAKHIRTEVNWPFIYAHAGQGSGNSGLDDPRDR